jgi:CheY-like chemotaxis protein
MAQTLRVLIVEDNQRDAALLVRELKRGGYDLTYERVETLEAMQGALGRQSWDLVVSDYSMPRFSAPAALNAVRAAELDLPFIIVSGTIGEDTAVAAMRAGASDFMQKGQLTRLLPAVARELREAQRRAGHRAIEQQLRHAQKMETMGQLTGGIAHDFNNMLSVIVAHLEMLKELMGGDPARVELIDGALNGAMGGADLIKRLLAFARQQPLSATTMDLNSRLPDTVAMLKRTLGEDIRISTSLAPDLWTVSAHRDAEYGPQQEQDGEVRRKAASKLDDRVAQHIDHQGGTTSPTVGRAPEQIRTDRSHRERQQDRECDLGDLGVELLRDVLEHEHQQEEIERVERPAEEARRDGVGACQT